MTIEKTGVCFFVQHTIDRCENSPCQNNGTCQSLINTYQCHCPLQYKGKNCEEKIEKPCSTDFCL